MTDLSFVILHWSLSEYTKVQLEVMISELPQHITLNDSVHHEIQWLKNILAFTLSNASALEYDTGIVWSYFSVQS